MCSRSFSFTVEPEYDGMSVKTYLRRMRGLTAHIMTLLKYSDNGITRDGVVLRAHDKLRASDTLTLRLPREENDIEPVRGEADVLYEDDCLLIVSKPADMPVHPVRSHQLDTLANIISYHQMNRAESYTFRALNRLDKDTSGCVVIAKDIISCALTLPTVSKEYLAVCEGEIRRAGTVDAPIAPAPDSRMRRCVAESGQRAVTHYEPLAYSEGHTLLRLTLETGRTHQIRCHMSYIGHPLAGDDMYGGSRGYIARQALHCSSVSLTHPVSSQRLTLEAALPADIRALIESADTQPLPAVDSRDSAEDAG